MRRYCRIRRLIRSILNEGGLPGPPSTSYVPYDSRKGHGYGTIDPEFDITYKMGSIYPYTEPPESDVDEDSDDISDIFSGNTSSIDKFVRMINKNVMRNDPSRRADRASFVSNQRISVRETNIPMRKGDSLYGTMSPIPKKALYGSFDGPAIGGSSANVAFNPGPLKRTGTQYGTSRAPLYLGSEQDDPGDDIAAYTLEDILEPDVKAVVKQRRRARRETRRRARRETQ